MIRPLEKKDIKKVVELEEKIFGETLGEEMLLNEINNPMVWFRVIEEKSEIIGYIGGYFYLEDGEILNFLIDENHQHLGFGSTLFGGLLQEAKQKGIKRVTLEVKSNNYKAIKFYKKFNFKQISIRKNYYKDKEDAIVMLKELI